MSAFEDALLLELLYRKLINAVQKIVLLHFGFHTNANTNTVSNISVQNRFDKINVNGNKEIM